SMDHQEGNDIPREYTAQAGFNLALGAKSKFELTPSAITTFSQNTVKYSPAVFLKHRNSYMVGASFRNLNMLTAHGGVLVGHHFRFTVAAGVPTSSDMRALGNIGYVQTGFRYQFGNRDRKTTPFQYE
ncbi:MAG: hypothetical protein AAGB22_15630, partial [Bacteroidota bacterium]